jgi:CRISPR-associated protein Cmr3
MTIWLIEPHDPLIFRDGRPFGPTPGADARSLQFPFPSTIAGAVRTHAGSDSDGVFQLNQKNYAESERETIHKRLSQLTQLSIRGPLLIQLPKKGRDITLNDWMVPAPKDAVIQLVEAKKLSADQKEDEYGQVKQLVPLAFLPEAHYDLKEKASDLFLVGLQQSDAGKPDKRTPRYWTWNNMLSWLLDPEQFQKHPHELQKLGHSGPEREIRTHIRIDAHTRTGEPGMLFSTSGLEFTANNTRTGIRLGNAQGLGLLVIVDDDKQNAENTAMFQLRPGPGCLGSERRIVNWRRSACEEPDCPDRLIESIAADEACRLILLTPAHFTEGYSPSWITGQRDDMQLQPKLKAIAIDRPRVVSGWDLARGGPKETRRLAPAGTVLFLSFKDTPKQAIKEWVRKTWMQCISDRPQDRFDGFGLAVLGTWSNEAQRREGQKI